MKYEFKAGGAKLASVQPAPNFGLLRYQPSKVAIVTSNKPWAQLGDNGKLALFDSKECRAQAALYDPHFPQTGPAIASIVAALLDALAENRNDPTLRDFTIL